MLALGGQDLGESERRLGELLTFRAPDDVLQQGSGFLLPSNGVLEQAGMGGEALGGALGGWRGRGGWRGLWGVPAARGKVRRRRSYAARASRGSSIASFTPARRYSARG